MAPGATKSRSIHWSTGQVQNVTPIPVRGPDVRVDRTEPLMFSPLDPHTLYYGANRLYRTRDGGASWQAISPDLAREAGGVPASVGALHPQGRRDAARRRSMRSGPRRSTRDVLWAGTDDGFVWMTARRRRALVERHAAGAHAVEQGHADRGLRTSMRTPPTSR